ncbi:MAG: metal-sensing transcriptional repressor [Traorella sp.]
MKADKKKIERLLNTAKGQLNGISKMIDEDRYCMDISNQILATQAILSKINEEILRAHMNHCVKEAFENGNGEEKVEEIINILNKMSN